MAQAASYFLTWDGKNPRYEHLGGSNQGVQNCVSNGYVPSSEVSFESGLILNLVKDDDGRSQGAIFVRRLVNGKVTHESLADPSGQGYGHLLNEGFVEVRSADFPRWGQVVVLVKQED